MGQNFRRNIFDYPDVGANADKQSSYGTYLLLVLDHRQGYVQDAQNIHIDAFRGLGYNPQAETICTLPNSHFLVCLRVRVSYHPQDPSDMTVYNRLYNAF
jgi:hypothetical protein